MCGITGFVDLNRVTGISTLLNMTNTMEHRGPDDNGNEVYCFQDATVGFGFNRLSIIDLSLNGHQPMHFERYTLVFNGEIYNFEEIKQELINLGHEFNSKSDSEVVIHAFAEWGDSCVMKFIGMFAIVILDRDSLIVTLMRDRAGTKPLHYYFKDGLFLFASELKAFLAHPDFVKKVNMDAFNLFVNFGYVPAPYSIFENCNKLEAGHILTFHISTQFFNKRKYWDVLDYYKLPSLNISYNDAKNKLEELLSSAFNLRINSDVPIGFFLSGGYDSTAVVSILQRQSKEKLKTYTIGFEGFIDEAMYANEISKFLGTDHTTYNCTAKDAEQIIENMADYFDEPFADTSVIPTILISKIAKKSVSVVLSGDAGDEIFAGYLSYLRFGKDLKFISMIPAFTRKGLSYFLNLISLLIVNRKLKNKLCVLANLLRMKREVLPQRLFQSYARINSFLLQGLLKRQISLPNNVFDSDYSEVKDKLSIALTIDYKMYLTDNIMKKVDIATMSQSLEGREPFLDHRIVEFVAQLPTSFKLNSEQKKILKDIVHKYVPKALMDRPKTGFIPPIYSWLKTDLKHILDDSLADLYKCGLFNMESVDRLKSDFLQNKLDDPSIIWRLIQFQLWHKKWLLNDSKPVSH